MTDSSFGQQHSINAFVQKLDLTRMGFDKIKVGKIFISFGDIRDTTSSPVFVPPEVAQKWNRYRPVN